MKTSLIASACIFAAFCSAFAIDPGNVMQPGMGEQPGMQRPGEGQQPPGEGQQQPGEGVQPGEGQQPDVPGGTGGAFVYDTFITESTGVGIDVRNGIWISTDRERTDIVTNSNLVEMVVGAAAGSVALTNVDLRMSAALAEIPSCAFAGCESLETVVLPTSVTNVAADAFIGCPKLKSISYVDATTDPATPDQPITPDEPVIPDQPVVPDEPGDPDQPTPPDKPEETVEPTPNPEPQGVSFERELIEAIEGDQLVVRVKGGCTNAASSVKLCLSCQTASASDLNLAKASVNGVQTKLTFPLVLA